MAILNNTGIRAGASGAGAGGYQIEKSLRFEGADSAKLTRTFSAGNKKKWTYSYWIKRCGDLGNHWYNSFLWAGASLSGNLRFDDPSTNQMYGILSSGVTFNTTRVFRDYSAWMHVVVVWDSNNSTAGDRFQLYIDGVRETSFTAISAISEGLDSSFNGNEIHGIGWYNSNTGLKCYLADVYFIDGYAKVPGDFAAADADTGQWLPKEYEDSLVEFSESTASGFSYWAGMGDDWEDSESTESGTNDYINRALPSDSKVYWEVTINNAGTYRNFGLQTGTGGLGEGYNDNTVGYYYNGNPPLFLVSGGGGGNGITHGSSTGTTWENGKKLMFAWDPTGGGSNGKLYLGYDGTWYNSGDPACGTGAVLTGMNTSSSWYLKTGYNNGGGSMTFTNVASGSAEWLPGSCTTTYHKNSCHLKFNGTDLGEDSSGNDNDWTANNLIQGLNTISSPNLPAWDHVDSGWTKSNSNKTGTFSGTNNYSHIATSALSDSTTYHFFYVKSETDNTGGWFFGDTQNPTNQHPDEIGGNTLGLRTDETGLGTYGTYTTANSTSDGQNQITGFDSIKDKVVNIEFVVNRNTGIDKVWCRKAGDSTWIGGGDPTNTSSTASFLLPASGTIYFGHVGYTGTTTATFSATDGDPLDIDVSTDTPTTFDDGGNGTGNYCTFNPLHSYGALSQGNLTQVGGAGDYHATSTWGFDKGKWYGEFTLGTDSYPGIGIINRTTPETSAPWTQSYLYAIYDGGASGVLSNYPGGAQHFSPQPTTLFSSGVFQIALDVDNGKCWIGFEDTWYSDQWATTGNPATGANPTWTLPSGKTWHFWLFSNGTTWTANFGQRPFSQTKPSGFLAPNTYNITDPTVKDPTAHVNSVLYTGTGSSQTISGVGFQPDLTWTVRRNGANANYLFNSVAGVSEVLYPTHAAGADAFSDFAFTSDGFTADGTEGGFNANTNTFVAWNWDANTSGSNDASSTGIGSIDSTYRVNTDAGFSIVSYVGTGANATVAHGLNAVPQMIMVKNREAAESWPIYHVDVGNGNRVYLNVDSAASSGTNWNSTTPTSSVFSIGTNPDVNQSTKDIIAFCWSEVDGYSKFGSYEGNGNADGPFVYCGFKPAILWLKNIDDGGNWVFLDNKRLGYNPDNNSQLIPVTGAENTVDEVDFLATGFKLRTALGWRNASAKTHIFAAWAESPFKYSNAQ